MTSESSKNQLPPFTGDMLSMPPTEFKNLRVRVFPLRARLRPLQLLCDEYLNIAPRETAYFRAVQPYTYLVIVDHSEFPTINESTAMFSILVERYEEINEKLVFRDWAMMATYVQPAKFGSSFDRFLFAFSRIPARIESTGTRVEIQGLSALAEQRVGYTSDVTVERVAPMSNLRFPFNAAGAAAPWNIAQRVSETLTGFGQDVTKLSQFLQAFEAGEERPPRHVAEKLGRATDIFRTSGGSRFIADLVGGVAFRNGGDPLKICHQALNTMTMEIRVNEIGLLGEDRLALGDLTGGYAVTLREKVNEEPERHMGLEIHRRWNEGPENCMTLQPVVPYWVDLDIRKRSGATLARRTGNGILWGGDGKRLDRAQQPVDSIPFNTVMPPAVDAAYTGPFKFTGAEVFVFPCPVKQKNLEEFLSKTFSPILLNPGRSKKGKKIYFRLSLLLSVGKRTNHKASKDTGFATAYLAVISLGKVTSPPYQLDAWAKYEVSFLIPIQVEAKEEGGDWNDLEQGLVPAWTIVDDSVAAVSRNEVLGIPTLVAGFTKPGNSKGEFSLRVDMQTANDSSPLLEIGRSGDASTATEQSTDLAAEWTRFLLSGLDKKNGRLAPLYTVKQFRDAADPTKACYQSLVRVQRRLTDIVVPRKLEDVVHVRVHDLPGLALADKFGIADQEQVVLPFNFRATIREDLGEERITRKMI